MREPDLHCYSSGAATWFTAGFTSSMGLRRKGRESATYDPHSAQTDFINGFILRGGPESSSLPDGFRKFTSDRLAQNGSHGAGCVRRTPAQFETFTKIPQRSLEEQQRTSVRLRLTLQTSWRRCKFAL